MEEKLVSICLVTYNQEKYIEECIRSILGINYPRLELLIGDDCSKDRTIELIKKYTDQIKSKCERFELAINETNVGICKNCNNLLKKAKGYYVKLHAGDDMSLPDGLSSIVEFYRKNDDCVLIHSDAIVIDSESRYPIDIGQYKRLHGNKKGISGMNLTTEILDGAVVASPSWLFKKETLEKYGYLDETLFYEDTEFLLRISLNNRIGYCDAVTYAYRIHDESASHLKNTSDNMLKQSSYLHSRKIVIDRYREYMTNKKYEEYLNEFLVKACMIGDKNLIEEIEQNLRENMLKIGFKEKIQILGSKMGIYQIYYDIKHR